MGNILYILGAGASAGVYSSYDNSVRLKELQGLPSVAPVLNMKERVRAIIGRIRSFNFAGISSSKYTSNDIVLALEEIKSDLDWFLLVLNREPFVDVLAETLFKTSEIDFKRLKRILAIYFLIEHSLSGVDLRYKTFITTLYSINKHSRIEFGDNVRILSWNYDCQFEEALFEKRGINNSRSVMKYMDKSIVTRSQFISDSYNSSDLFLLKLNGAAHVYKYDQSHSSLFNDIVNYSSLYMFELLLLPEGARLNELMRLFCEVYIDDRKSNCVNTISFAWDEEREGLIEKISNYDYLKTVDEVVVIGYSFPSLNWEIDNAIFSQIPSNNVYIQCVESDFKAIKGRLQILSAPEKSILPVFGLNEFYVPYKALR